MRTLLSDLPLACRRELVQLLEEATPVGTWDWNIVANEFFWSPRQFIHFGLRPVADGAIRYEAWLEAIHADDRQVVQAEIADTIASGKPLHLTFRVLWRDSEDPAAVKVRWLRSRGTLIRDVDGSPLRMVGTSSDVTEEEQSRALAKVRRDAQLIDQFGGPSRFDVYFQSSPDCMFQLRVEAPGRFTYQMINPAGLAAINRTMADLHGLTPTEVLGPENGARMVAALDAVLETGLPYSYQPVFSYGNGSVAYEATYMPVRGEQGDINAIIGRARDITLERRMEAALHQAQKMEALGQLATGIAHDFNNLLAGLHGCFSVLDRAELPARARHAVRIGGTVLQQGKALTRQLLAFARKQEFETRAVALDAKVAGMLDMLRSSLPGVRVVARLDAGDGEVLAADGLIEGCLLNLCINARDAAQDQCEITIRTALIDDGEPPHVDLPAGRYASLSVADNGPGMPPDVLLRACEPFFTTKAPGQGSGLGLSMVYGTVRSLGGAVLIRSEPGRGTVVTLFLRRAPAVPDA